VANLKAAAVLLLAVLVVVACGGEDEPEGAPPAAAQPTPVLEALRLLPDEEPLHRQVLFGDVARLRQAYAGSDQLNVALAGLWLPDALAGATRPVWGRAYGFRLAAVDRFVAAGFHPEAVAVLTGRFEPAEVRATLRANGYRRRNGMLTRGGDGSVETDSSAGRLALSSLDRVAVREGTIVAASTTELARATLELESSLADDPDLAAAAHALGPVTAAVILPADLVRPPVGELVVPVVEEPVLILGVGVDDRGGSDRIFKVALVYEAPAAAEQEAERLADAFADAEVPTRAGQHFSDLFEEPSAEVVGDRAVLLQGRIADFELAGVWRGLLETGDLSVLVPAR
jgi:hypothetical protein